MDRLIEVSANDYKKGIEAVAKLEIIERYLNENQDINGNDMRKIVGLPKINR